MALSLGKNGADPAAAPAGETARPYRPGGPRAVVLLGLLCLAFFFDYTDRFVLSAILPFIKRDWNLSDQARGTLTGILSVPMAVLVIPLSLAVDRWSRKKMLSIMVFLWSLATLACAFSRNFTQLLLARALMVLPVFGVVAGLLFLGGAKWYQGDLERVRTVVLLEE